MTDIPDSPAASNSVPINEAAPGVEVQNNIDNINAAGDASVIGYVQQLNAFYGDGRHARAFTAKDAQPVSNELAEMLDRVYVDDGQLTEKLLERLEHRRILVLTGGPGCGKTTMAFFLSTRLASRKRLDWQVHEVPPLDAHVTINIRSVVETWNSFSKRATVFRDAFSSRNRDLLGFFSREDAPGWERLTETLRDRKAYLIFTASQADVAPFRQQLMAHTACEELQPIGDHLAPAALDRRVEWFRDKEPAKEAHFAAIAEHRQFIIEKLRTVPQISAFLEFFMGIEPDVLAAERQFSNVTHWFVDVLPADVEAWCAVVALTLAQAVRDATSVPWLDFERLRRAITETIRADAEMFPRRGGGARDEGQNEQQTSARRLTDEVLLKRARIVVGNDSDRLGDVVHFDKHEVASEVWPLLLTHSRRVLSSLLPVLSALTGDSRPSMRVLAAQILGRLGELDPRAITIPLIEQWGETASVQRSLIGRVMQGVFGSRRDSYRYAAMGALQALGDRGGEGAKERRLAVIGAYSHLGVYEPELAMQKLGALAIARLVPVMDNIRQLSRMIERVDQKLSTVSDRDSADDLLVHGLRLGRLAQKLTAHHAAALMAVERAVVYLCLMNIKDDPVLILRFMRDWIANGGPAAGILVSILFLHEDGIADDLEIFQIDSGSETVSPIVRSLAARKEAGPQLCAFLADIHASINSTFTLPMEVQRDLRERFTACLTAWALGAAVSNIHRPAVEELFVALMSARGGVMRNEVYSMLGRPPFTDQEPLQTLAAGVRLRMIQKEEPCNLDRPEA